MQIKAQKFVLPQIPAIEIFVGESKEPVRIDPLQSLKYCRRCMDLTGKLVKRFRKYTLVGPMLRSACDPVLPVLSARVSSKIAWWNKGLIRWLVAPPGPPTDDNWYELHIYARCPKCGSDHDSERLGIRQFGRIRVWLFWVQDRILHSLNWIISIR